jgi:hypothetical protein
MTGGALKNGKPIRNWEPKNLGSNYAKLKIG